MLRRGRERAAAGGILPLRPIASSLRLGAAPGQPYGGPTPPAHSWSPIRFFGGMGPGYARACPTRKGAMAQGRSG